MGRLTAILLSLALAGAFAAEASAQTAPEGYRAVDGTVEDYTDNGVSLRRFNFGNEQFSRRNILYRPDVPTPYSRAGLPSRDHTTGLYMPGEYRLETNGLSAMVANPEYLALTSKAPEMNMYLELNKRPVVDGAYLEVISAGTVFDLIPNAGGSIQAYTPPDDWVDTRISGQFEGRVDGRTSLPMSRDPNMPLPTDTSGRIIGQVNGTVSGQR